MTKASEIARRVGTTVAKGDPDAEISGATHDSREVRPGFLFAALSGENLDGRKFVSAAIDAGARAILSSSEIEAPSTVAQIVVADPRRALGPAAALCSGDPTRSLRLVGVTGTNGKTTTTYLLEAALGRAGGRPGVMGTVEYRFGPHHWAAAHTTPEATVVQSIARKMKDAGATHLAMEVSSHGLALGRLGGCDFDVAAFTNLTQDHLDFHRDMESYAAAKMLLFTEALEGSPSARCAVNVDDPFGEKVARAAIRPSVRVSCDPSSRADVRPVTSPIFSEEGIRAKIAMPTGTIELSSPLVGAHNLANLLLTLGICAALEEDISLCAEGLATFSRVPGRLERVPCDLGFSVLVDYAHTPDALTRVLEALRPFTAGRILCVFGCGGDRDPKKRPKMGEAVARGADLSFVTSDNPRTEEPGAIIDMIVPGVIRGGRRSLSLTSLPSAESGFVVEPDRAAAIALAVDAARPGDTVLVAGKGHEDYQILGTTKIHFDDREQAAAAIAARMGRLP